MESKNDWMLDVARGYECEKDKNTHHPIVLLDFFLWDGVLAGKFLDFKIFGVIRFHDS